MQTNAVKVTIPEDEFCLCGSGKEYGVCCKKKNHIYEAFTIGEEGKQIIYDQTEIMNAVSSLLTFIETRINSESRTLTKEEAFRKLKKLYQKLDVALQPIGKIASCKAGCSHCCKILIPASRLEGDLLKAYMESHYSKEEIKNFKEKINKNKELLKRVIHGEDKFLEENYKAYNESKISCAFLDKDERCTSYEARPFVCRRYLVFNEPDICENKSKTTNQYYSKYLTTVKNAIVTLNKLVYGDACEYKHILSWFVED